MPSQNSKEIAKRIAVALTIASVSVTGSAMQQYGDSKQVTVGGAAIEFLAAQIDFTAELIQTRGRITPIGLSIMFAQKGLALSDFMPRETLQCGGALASFGLIGVASLASGVPSGGVGTILTGTAVLAEGYGAWVDCKKILTPVFSDLGNGISSFSTRLRYELNDWITSNNK